MFQATGTRSMLWGQDDHAQLQRQAGSIGASCVRALWPTSLTRYLDHQSRFPIQLPNFFSTRLHREARTSCKSATARIRWPLLSLRTEGIVNWELELPDIRLYVYTHMYVHLVTTKISEKLQFLLQTPKPAPHPKGSAVQQGHKPLQRNPTPFKGAQVAPPCSREPACFTVLLALPLRVGQAKLEALPAVCLGSQELALVAVSM